MLHNNAVWQAHGASVTNASLYLPVCLKSRVSCNPTEKISSGYKAVEYLVYIFGLCLALLYCLLSQKFYLYFCKLVFATCVIYQHHKLKDDLLAAHKAFLKFVYKFEILFYNCDLLHLHFVWSCIHTLTHIVPEHFHVGSLTKLFQWIIERTIGNLREEIRLHSNPYANSSQRVIECTCANALYALAPDLFHIIEKLPTSACDIGQNYILLDLCEYHEMDVHLLKPFTNSQTYIIGELKIETQLVLTYLQGLFCQMGRLHGCSGMRRSGLLKRFR